jgi:hypothetical protein
MTPRSKYGIDLQAPRYVATVHEPVIVSPFLANDAHFIFVKLKLVWPAIVKIFWNNKIKIVAIAIV